MFQFLIVWIVKGFKPVCTSLTCGVLQILCVLTLTNAPLFLSRKKAPIIFDYKLADSSVRRTNLVKYLGVLLDSWLTFNDHLEHTLSKPLRMLGFMLRVANDFRDPFSVKS